MMILSVIIFSIAIEAVVRIHLTAKANSDKNKETPHQEIPKLKVPSVLSACLYIYPHEPL